MDLADMYIGEGQASTIESGQSSSVNETRSTTEVLLGLSLVQRREKVLCAAPPLSLVYIISYSHIFIFLSPFRKNFSPKVEKNLMNPSAQREGGREGGATKLKSPPPADKLHMEQTTTFPLDTIPPVFLSFSKKKLGVFFSKRRNCRFAECSARCKVQLLH